MLKPCLNYVQTVYEPCLPWAMTWQDQLLYELCHCVHQPMPGTAVPFTKSFSLEWKIWKTLLWYTTVSYSIIPWPRIWYFICCSRLLICLLNLFPFYGVTDFFCTNLHSPTTKSDHLTSWTKLRRRRCHLGTTYIWEWVDLVGFGSVDLEVSGSRSWWA